MQRLRTGRDPKYVELELATDDTCREISRTFVWPPSADGGSAAAAAAADGDYDAAPSSGTRGISWWASS